MSKKVITFVNDYRQFHAATRRMGIPSFIQGEIGMAVVDEADIGMLADKLRIISLADLEVNFYTGQEVQVSGVFCFERKKTTGTIPGGRINRLGEVKNKTIYVQSGQSASGALQKFLKNSGLAQTSVYGGRAAPMSPIMIHDNPIHNLFSISGTFIVSDLGLFKKALETGVGGRKSYGFGMVMVKV